MTPRGGGGSPLLNGQKSSPRQGGKILYGGKVVDRPGNYVMPTITQISPNAPVVQHEIFVPILHTFKFKVNKLVPRASDKLNRNETFFPYFLNRRLKKPLP